MKKFGFMLLAVAALMASCGDPNTQATVESITLNENEVTLALGGDIKLQANVQPAGAATVAWASDNEEVATVKQNGLVQAVGAGECTITATAGDKSATCKVIVDANAAYDFFEIADYGLFGEFTPIEGTEPLYTKLTNGDSVKCVLNYIRVYAWDSNVQWVNGEGFIGDGIACDLGEMAFYIIEEDYDNPKYNGYYLGEGGVFVYNTKEVVSAIGKPGHIDVATYGDFVQAQYSADLEANFEEMQEKTNGALLSLCSADEGWENWYGLYYGAINRLIVLDGEEEGDPLSVAADVTWCNYTDEDRIYGYAVDLEIWDAEKKVQLVTPYDYKTVNMVYDEFELFDRFEANNSDILATKEYKIGTRYMGAEKPLVNGKQLDATKLHMAR